jgi:RimJ/RimL family protein N-acetyltransferase
MKRIRQFREFVTLSNYKKVLIRPTIEKDLELVYDMFQRADDDDMIFLKDKVKNKGTVERWYQNIDFSRVFPVVAMYQDKIVGSTTLHFMTKSKRHMAEIRIFLDKDFRGIGLGSYLVKSQIKIAKELGLKYVIAEIISEHYKLIKSFRKLGFSRKCDLEDYFMTDKGKLYDITIMMYDLQQKESFEF